MDGFLLQILLRGLLVGGIYALLSVGLTLIFGVLEIPHFAYGDIMMLAMYTCFWLQVFTKTPIFLSIIIIFPLYLALGCVLQKTVVSRIMDKPALSKMLFMMGFSLFLQGLALFFWTADTRFVKSEFENMYIDVGGGKISLTYVINFIVAMIVFLGFYVWLQKTYMGKAIRASAQNKELALVSGINIQKIFLVSFGVATAISAVGAVLFAPIYYIGPFVGIELTIKSFMIVVLGGLGSIEGALLGGLIIGVAESLSSYFLSSEVKELTTFIIFMLVLLFRPKGLLGKEVRE
ncbi:MAG: branched-chain amino acid ABC transporter permease [Desulfurococcales archaeon ex4484_217_2]|nr:MAG: branched-chain amino acid ABC transporter permease [Desulfurococcales archaeon ex4484_217_2]